MDFGRKTIGRTKAIVSPSYPGYKASAPSPLLTITLVLWLKDCWSGFLLWAACIFPSLWKAISVWWDFSSYASQRAFPVPFPHRSSQTGRPVLRTHPLLTRCPGAILASGNPWPNGNTDTSTDKHTCTAVVW